MFIILLLTIISIISANKLLMNSNLYFLIILIMLLFSLLCLNYRHNLFHKLTAHFLFKSACTKSDSTFRPEPIETVMLDDIEYSFYNYRVTWEEAKIICLGYKSQLVTLDTEKKAIYVTGHLAGSTLDFEELWIGSKKNLRGDWIWDANDEKILTNNFFHNSTTIPKYESRFRENDFHCLTVHHRYYHMPLLISRRCSEQKPFMCEKDTFSPSNVVKVFTVNIGKKMLVLFSANLTWSEAVFQCRQQGLQIAEISTLTEARSMAVGMLKNRPRSIESAWIAGYINNRVWKWLSSGINIPQNELWQSTRNDSGNCLLLHRHICERPSYLSLRCDRRRDFICQMPQQDEPGSDPLQVTINNCKYWIMVVPLNWHEANQHCRTLNSKLVSLDSPATVNHIANIMLDNKELLRHIWIGGKKEFVEENFTGQAIWKWDDTGNAIPGPDESFIPWCKDSRLFEQNSDCLNMDLEDVDGLIVYGLNCNNKQRYMCQEESTMCIEMKNKLSPLYVNHSETVPKSNTTILRFNATNKSNVSEHNNKKFISIHQNSSESSEVALYIDGKSKGISDGESINNSTANDKSTKSIVTEFIEKMNSQQPSSVKNRNLKEIIEYMVKKVNDDRLETMQNTSLLRISTSQYYDKSVVSSQTQVTPIKTEQALSIKENVSKIVQLSMEKNLWNISSTISSVSISNLENAVTEFPTMSKNLFSTQVDRPLQKNQEDWIKSVPFGDNDPDVIINFWQIMRNAFDKDRFNNFDNPESIESIHANKKSKAHNIFYNTSRNKNEISTLIPTSTIVFEKRIQSLENNRIKNVNDVKVNEIVDAFKHRIHDPNLKQEISSLHADNLIDSKKNYINPWNVLLNRVVQSFNHTDKKLVGFKVLEFP